MTSLMRDAMTIGRELADLRDHLDAFRLGVTLRRLEPDHERDEALQVAIADAEARLSLCLDRHAASPREEGR